MFAGWEAAFPGVDVAAVDLQGNLDVAAARMRDYKDAVVAMAAHLRPPTALCGWSMGGLVVLQSAAAVQSHSVVVIEPSPPAEIQGFHPGVELRRGTFDPEGAYGRFPTGRRSRPESLLARLERKRGISVPALPCRSMVVYGDSFPDERGRRIARLYGSAEAYFPGLDHWDLVSDQGVRSRINQFLRSR